MKTAENKKLSYKNSFKNNVWMLKQIFECVPGLVITNIVFGVLWGVYDSVSTIYTKILLDNVTNGSAFITVLKIIIIYAAYTLLLVGYNTWFNHIFVPVNNEKLLIKLNVKLFRQAALLDLEKYDNPEFYNDFIWSLNEAYNRSVQILNDLRCIISRILGSITIFAVLFSIDRLIATIIFAGSLLRVFVSFYDNKLFRKISEENQPLFRKDEYIRRIHTLPDFAKDLKISHIGEVLSKEYEKNKLEKDKITLKYAFKKAFIRFINPAIPLIAETLIYIIMIYKVMITGTLTIGSIMVALSSIWRVSWFFRDIVTRFMKFHEHGIYIEKIITFVSSKPKITSGEKNADDFQSLEIKNLSFAYPNGKENPLALKNINLNIKKGEKIALVGYNGAGKTTLTKLIMRLYECTEGEILYNGTPLKEFDLTSLRGKIAAVFQDYRIFAGTIAENVVGGEYTGGNDRNIIKALEKSAFSEKLNKLKNGINTMLTREFSDDGTELSGGEKQKIAIARAFYKNADLIILDEPSSALDPNAEYELNKAITEYAKEKTVIFISHRLSTTRHADKIYMFGNGEIIESGTHEELIKLNGKYAYMFNLQAEKYRK